jgi:hypothetical protein
MFDKLKTILTMKIFLRLKHWQVFSLTWGIPFFTAIIGDFIVFQTKDFRIIFEFFPFIFMFFIIGFMGWMWSAGTNLYEKLPGAVKMNIRLFKTFVIIPSVYMLIVALYILGGVLKLNVGEMSPLIVLALILPLHLFSMFCMFYNLYFVAKTLKAVQLQRPVKFEDYAGEFFMIWFFPIGVWIIQPRINKIFSDENTVQE